ncbi:hypothetical protein XENOCAPTIV_007212, partial [Xenoophorus captivus]
QHRHYELVKFSAQQHKLYPPFALLSLSFLLSLLGFARLVKKPDQDHSGPDAGFLVVVPPSAMRHAGRFCWCQEGFGRQLVQGQAGSRGPEPWDLLGFVGFQCEQ